MFRAELIATQFFKYFTRFAVRFSKRLERYRDTLGLLSTQLTYKCIRSKSIYFRKRNIPTSRIKYVCAIEARQHGANTGENISSSGRVVDRQPREEGWLRGRKGRFRLFATVETEGTSLR